MSNSLIFHGVNRKLGDREQIQFSALRASLVEALSHFKPTETLVNAEIHVHFDDGEPSDSNLEFHGLEPTSSKQDREQLKIFSNRITAALSNFVPSQNLYPPTVRVYFNSGIPSSYSQTYDVRQRKAKTHSRLSDDPDAKPKDYQPKDPIWTFDDVVLEERTRRSILRALTLLRHHDLIYEDWNLKSIDPLPRVALNFFGPPGTGKTMTAHALASSLEKKILALNYADIESKYVGEAPKNLVAAFRAAERNEAVLFFDEADSILGKRITNVSQGADQAINSLRSQMALALDNFTGIVVFATNLLENYDFAFESRITHIPFNLPGESARLEIWRRHLPKELPLSDDVDLATLSQQYDGISGRDIHNAVLTAVSEVVLEGRQVVCQEDLVYALESVIAQCRAVQNIRRGSAISKLTTTK